MGKQSGYAGFKRCGICAKIFSGIFDEHFPIQCTSNQYYQSYDAASLKLWGMLADIIEQKQKTLYIVHSLEPHYPCFNCKMSDDNYKERSERYRAARLELDGQLVTDGSITKSEFIKKYVEIGLVDYYNGRDIGRVFKEKVLPPSHYFEYTIRLYFMSTMRAIEVNRNCCHITEN